MCGIVGHLAFDPGFRISESLLGLLSRLLRHRGPDSHGVYLKDDVALAVRRLAIIDLQGGDQPIISEDGRYVIVFNGEIYNHDELRQRLVGKGYPLRTRSDTESLLYAFVDRGPDCLQDLNGMFAFVIWDDAKKELFLARDRLGIKPLYYALDAKRFMFCSELTPIYRSALFSLKLNYRAVSDYLAYWYVCEPDTLFEGVAQLPPGSYAVVREGRMHQAAYWELPSADERPVPFEQAAEQLEALLDDAVRLRTKVDVPLGTFLSGGVDSGLVTALAARHVSGRLKAFSIGFREKSYSEFEEASKSASRHGVEVVSSRIDRVTPDMVDTVIGALDEPLGNASFVPTYFLAKLAREQVKVVLTGDGGDELFGGYPTYQAPYYQAMYRRAPAPLIALARSVVLRLPVSHRRISLDFRLKQLMRGVALPYRRAHYTWREVAPIALQERLFRDEIWQCLWHHDPFSVVEAHFERAGALSRKNQLMFVDLKTYLLSDHLRKVDRMTMAHSLEAGVPYLDHRVVEFAMSLPSEHKVTLFETKRILKRVARPYLPRSVVSGKKKGLTSPIAVWLCTDLRDYMHEALKGGLMDELFKRDVVEQLLDEHCERKRDNSRLIWGLLTLRGWSRRLKENVGCE